MVLITAQLGVARPDCGQRKVRNITPGTHFHLGKLGWRHVLPMGATPPAPTQRYVPYNKGCVIADHWSRRWASRVCSQNHWCGHYQTCPPLLKHGSFVKQGRDRNDILIIKLHGQQSEIFKDPWLWLKPSSLSQSTSCVVSLHTLVIFLGACPALYLLMTWSQETMPSAHTGLSFSDDPVNWGLVHMGQL